MYVELHGERCDTARFGHQFGTESLPPVWIQGSGVCSGFLRQVLSGGFDTVQARFLHALDSVTILYTAFETVHLKVPILLS